MRREKINFKVNGICRSSLPIIEVKVIQKQNKTIKRRGTRITLKDNYKDRF